MSMTAERNLGARLRSASRIEADRLPRLKLIGDEWAGALQAGLAQDFGAQTTIEYHGAVPLERAATVGEGPALLLVATSQGWSQPALVTTDAGFAGFVVECLLGGDGKMPAIPGRASTELDLRFCRVVLERLLAVGNAALKPVMDARMAVERIFSQTIAERLEAYAPDAAPGYTQLSFRMSLGACAGVVRVAIPDPVLALARRKLDHLPEPPAPSVDLIWAREIEEGLLDAEMSLTALLDEKATTLGAIAGFRVGQTIVLNAGIDSPITIECEEQRLFRGRMGRSRDSYLVRIEEKIDPTEEFIDDILAD